MFIPKRQGNSHTFNGPSARLPSLMGRLRQVSMFPGVAANSANEGKNCIGATLPGNPLYPLARTGPVVPAHPGDDQEQEKLSGKVCRRTLSRAARS